MVQESRREWLRWVSLLGALGLAGCGESDPPTATESAASTSTETATVTNPTEQVTTTEEPIETAASITVDTTVTAEADVQRVTFAGEVIEPAGIEVISIAVGDRRTQIPIHGETRHALGASVTVDGGRHYSAMITVQAVDGTERVREVDLGIVPTPLDPVEPDRLVGVHYYPWYEMHDGHQNWTEDCVSDPALGEYAADNPAVIEQHLRWCLNHGIRWLSVSWWGPRSGTDRALRNALLDMDLFREVQFSILYETKGRLEEFDYDLDTTGARDRLRSDLQHLQTEYFTESNYLRLEDRPVVFLYIANALQGDVEAAFEAVTADVGVDLYLLADLPFGTPPSNYRITPVADAITSYNPYSSRTDIEAVFHDLYEQGNTVLHLGADAADVNYVPVVIPGFNDTAIPDSQREDNPILTASPERYERVCSQVTPHLGDAEAVLVTSFNEWYENTQIEPNETYDDAYLTLTRDRLATGPVPEFTASGTRVRLAFNKTVQPANVNPESSDHRELAFMAGELRFTDGGDPVAEYNIGTAGEEPVFLEGVYWQESTDERSWRWFGGRTQETTIYVRADISNADTGIIVGQPMVSDEIEATVYVEGNRTARLGFGARDGFDEYHFEMM